MSARTVVAGLGLLFLLPLAPATLGAQAEMAELDLWDRQAQLQLFAYRLQLDLDELSHEIGTGSLDEGDSEVLTFTAVGPGWFTVLGVCDNDCTDVDLTLYDMDGNELDTDVEIDDFPVVETPRLASGLRQRFQVRISMFECSVSPCRYAVAVFAN